MNLLKKLTPNGPKRILALDGGGIRGVLSLGFLERVEDMLRRRHGNPGLRLADYFDLIGAVEGFNCRSANAERGKVFSHSDIAQNKNGETKGTDDQPPSIREE